MRVRINSRPERQIQFDMVLYFNKYNQDGLKIIRAQLLLSFNFGEVTESKK